MSAIYLFSFGVKSNGATNLYQSFVGERYVDATQLQEWRSDMPPCSVLLVLADSLSVIDDLGGGRDQWHELSELSAKVIDAILVDPKEEVCFSLLWYTSHPVTDESGVLACLRQRYLTRCRPVRFQNPMGQEQE